jgi:anti-sigma factor RsiW
MSTSAHPTERLTDLADGRLGDTEAAAIRRHLDGCPDCRRDFDWLVAGRMAARSAAGAERAPEGLRASVIAALDAEDAAAIPMPVGLRSRRALWAGLAAAAVVALYVAGSWPRATGDAVDRAHAGFVAVRDGTLALARHTGDAAALERYFAEAGTSSPIRVIDLGMMGWTIEGGVTHPFDGGLGGLYAYRSAAGQRLVCQMYTGRLDALPAGAAVRHQDGFEFRSYTRGGVTLVFWQEGDVVCVLAAELPAAAVLDLAIAKAMAPA